MGKPKKSEVLRRPSLPSAEEILADVCRASDNDPVFASAHELFGAKDSAVSSAMDGSGLDDASDGLEDPHVELQYTKVCELLDMLSSMRSGKDQLENSCHHLLSCKEDVSAVALQLKTRLEKHKLLSAQSMKK